MAEPQIQYATSADGTRIAYAVRPGTPPAILLIWGWPQTIGAPYGLTVAPSRTIVNFDRRGMGASSRDVQDISIDRQVEDIGAIVAALGANRSTSARIGTARQSRSRLRRRNQSA